MLGKIEVGSSFVPQADLELCRLGWPEPLSSPSTWECLNQPDVGGKGIRNPRWPCLSVHVVVLNSKLWCDHNSWRLMRAQSGYGETGNH